MSATGADGGNLKLMKDEKLSGKASGTMHKWSLDCIILSH